MVEGAIHRNVSTNAMRKETRSQRQKSDDSRCAAEEHCTEQSRRADRWQALLSVVPEIETNEDGEAAGAPRSNREHESRSGTMLPSKSDWRSSNEDWAKEVADAAGADKTDQHQNSKAGEDVSVHTMDDEACPQRQRGANTSRKKSSSYNCNLCGSTFAEKFNLNKHVRTVHEKKRPFSCHICPVTFKQKDHLKKHVMTVHERKRPFACDLCGATFGWVSVLNKHVRSVHEKKRPFECTVCHYSFQQRGHLDKHVLTAHKSSERRPSDGDSGA
mmetsp:Transcript_8211/g.24705  ORF Transcript_8211/g.24705 Transcript_8211/m.24705 type:complete len:273 (-) Transcript_8211:148-966(-)